ncbi:hypothetical protein JTB14_005536 [Gonioctena quinquepunctata]|nr:hypothetical protein JTB14_005536 [Gonioctena quinquepunctata]
MEDNNEVQTLHPPPQKPKNKDTTVETQISHKKSLAEIQTPPTEKENEPQPNFENFRQPISTNLKRPRARTSTENLSIMSEQLLLCKKYFKESKETLILNYQQFTDFMENVHGTSDPLSVAQQYTNDIDALINVITETHPFFTQRSMKSKCTKLKKRLKKQQLINPNPTPYSDTDSEISSQELY